MNSKKILRKIAKEEHQKRMSILNEFLRREYIELVNKGYDFTSMCGVVIYSRRNKPGEFKI